MNRGGTLLNMKNSDINNNCTYILRFFTYYCMALFTNFNDLYYNFRLNKRQFIENVFVL